MTRSFEPEPDLDLVLPDLTRSKSGFKAGYPDLYPDIEPDPLNLVNRIQLYGSGSGSRSGPVQALHSAVVSCLSFNKGKLVHE